MPGFCPEPARASKEGSVWRSVILETKKRHVNRISVCGMYKSIFEELLTKDVRLISVIPHEQSTVHAESHSAQNKRDEVSSMGKVDDIVLGVA
ncbi:hypothetical protein GcC1_018016 [Golovinomyces cichoracearum]|uniref:Uncharacterized protein n=1 Tax=Golovinomyces cichoracearum TaxID=62708 RepID=A0A420J5R7_9PEZI|nr:hypothetical protein GcC1_018016 [Golovinomyces cichoracearum]